MSFDPKPIYYLVGGMAIVGAGLYLFSAYKERKFEKNIDMSQPGTTPDDPSIRGVGNMVATEVRTGVVSSPVVTGNLRRAQLDRSYTYTRERAAVDAGVGVQQVFNDTQRRQTADTEQFS